MNCATECMTLPGDIYRAVITAADDTVKWVDLPTAGAETFMQDYSAGGGKGAIHSFKRLPSVKVAQYQYGYNQVRPWTLDPRPEAGRQWAVITHLIWLIYIYIYACACIVLVRGLFCCYAHLYVGCLRAQ